MLNNKDFIKILTKVNIAEKYNLISAFGIKPSNCGTKKYGNDNEKLFL